MDINILNTEVQTFINSHLDSDLNSLLLKGGSINGVPIKTIVEQIEAKRKCEKKLPTWYHTDGIYYPNKLNIEQTSSETSAQFKSKCIHGKSLVDITGGFGVDSYFFSKQISEVIHIEQDEELSNIAKANAKRLGTNNIVFIAGNGLVALKKTESHYDWIYIDPSRRHDKKGKVFFLEDCTPNVPLHLDFLFTKADHIMIKTAPLLDISVGLNELKHVDSIYTIAVNNELKEVLWILKKDSHENDIQVSAVNITNDNLNTFRFNLKSEKIAQASFNKPLTYLYEPNVAINKSGAFKTVSEQLKTHKLHENSHLYTSSKLIDFPGRRFKIETVIPYQKKVVKKALPNKANITTKNFPENVQQLRKKFGLKDGGDIYIFFTTNCHNEKIVIVCSKINL